MANYIEIEDYGSYASIDALWAAHPEGGQEGDYCTIAGVKYRWDKYDRMWVADPNFGPTPARSVTTFDGDVIMQNNLTVAGYIRAKGIKQPCVGLFASLAALEAKWPDPEAGMWALVGDSISSTSPAAVYRCNTDGTWAATGGTATLDNVEFDIANGIAGWVPISSTSQLPTDPTPDQQGRGYLLGGTLYVYVGEGGDTLDGKYQSTELKGADGQDGQDGAPGPQGPAGVGGNAFMVAASASDTSGWDTDKLYLIPTSTSGVYKVYYYNGSAWADSGQTITATAVNVVNDLTTGGEGDALSAEQGKFIGSLLDLFSQIVWEQTIKCKDMPTRASTPILLAGQSYDIHLQAEADLGQTYWELWAYTQSGQVKIKSFGQGVDMSVEQVVSYTPESDIYSLGSKSSSGISDISTKISYWLLGAQASHPLEKANGVASETQYSDDDCALFTAVQRYGSMASSVGVTEPIMKADNTYLIKASLNKEVNHTAYQIWGCNAPNVLSDTSTTVMLGNIDDNMYTAVRTLEVTPSVNIYSIGTRYHTETGTVPKDAMVTLRICAAGCQLIKEMQSKDDELADMTDLRSLVYIKGERTKTSITSLGIITAGQSNADGRVPIADLPSDYSLPLAGCKMWYNNAFADYSQAMLSSDKWAFDLVTYKYLVDALSTIHVVKFAEGGASIDSEGGAGVNTGGHWSPWYEGFAQSCNKLLLTLENKIRAALASGDTFQIGAMLWHQGEGDYLDSTRCPERYYRNFSALIAYVRGVVGNPELPIIYGTISHNSGQYHSLVEEAQWRIAKEDKHCHCIDMSGATLLDEYHFDATSAEYLGKAMFNALIDAKVVNATKLVITPPWEE